MKKFFTCMILMALFAVNAMAQDLTYELTSYVGSSYEGFTQKIDVEAVEAALGCTISEASAFAVQSDLTEDPSYNLGETDGWRNAQGDWSGWGDNGAFCVKADFLGETDEDFPYAGFYYIGGHSGRGDHLTAPTTYTATYKLYNSDNTKSINIFVKLNYIERPTLKLSDLTIVGSAETTITEYPKTSYKATWYGIETKDICDKLDVTADELANGISNMMFVKKLQTGDLDCMWDGSTIASCASSAFSQILDEQGLETEECGSSESATKFWIDGVGFDADSVWVNFGQEANACQADDHFFGYVYIVNGTKAYQLKVNLKVEPKPETGGFADMTKVGSQTITLIRDINSGYSTTTVDLNVSEIEAGLGVTLGSATFMAFSSEAKDELTDSYTTSTTGFWMDMHSIPMGWDESAQSYFVDAYLSDGNVQIGHMPNMFEGGEKTDGSLFIVFGNNYYELVMDVQIGEEPDPEAKTPEECEIVAERSYTYEIVPGSSYQDDFMGSTEGMIDLDNDWITETLGGAATFYGMKEDTSTSTLGYSVAYSCDPKPGFWMIPTTGEYQFNNTAVGTWGSTNTFGVCYADGVLQFFQYPDVRAIGDSYDADFYLVNINEGKKIKLHLTVNYVAERSSTKNVVGSEDLVLPSNDNDDYAETECDLSKCLEALAVDYNTFIESVDWKAVNASGKATKEGYGDAMYGFWFNSNGDPTSEEEAKLYSAEFLDSNNSDCGMDCFRTYAMEEGVFKATLAADYGENRYLFNLIITDNPTAISSVNVVSAKQSAVYDLSGRQVANPQKGVYIQNGKKLMIK